MSDLALYEQLASACIRRYRHNAEGLRRTETHMLLERGRALTAEGREGYDLVLERIREAIAQLKLPLQAGGENPK